MRAPLSQVWPQLSAEVTAPMLRTRAWLVLFGALASADTALHRAAASGDAAWIKKLVAALEALSADTAKAALEAQSVMKWTALHYAAREGHVEAVEALVAAGASLDARSEAGCTPLDVAAANGRTEAAAALVGAGAPLESMDTHKRTACRQEAADQAAAKAGRLKREL